MQLLIPRALRLITRARATLQWAKRGTALTVLCNLVTESGPFGLRAGVRMPSQPQYNCIATRQAGGSHLGSLEGIRKGHGKDADYAIALAGRIGTGSCGFGHTAAYRLGIVGVVLPQAYLALDQIPTGIGQTDAGATMFWSPVGHAGHTNLRTVQCV